MNYSLNKNVVIHNNQRPKNDNKIKTPLLLKVSPDIEDKHISEISDLAIENYISAVVLTNTTNGNRNNLT